MTHTMRLSFYVSQLGKNLLWAQCALGCIWAMAQTTPNAPGAASENAQEAALEAYGVVALLAQSDWVAKLTLLILLVMSVGSWFVIATKLMAQNKHLAMAKEAKERFWVANSVKDGLQTLSEKSPFRFLVEVGLEANAPQKGILAPVERDVWLSMALQRGMSQIQSELQNGLSWLATVGSTAPFVGLFGTVWGIYNALMKIGLTGQASIDKVAGPVGESLIMTAIGLAVAVPAVLGYNWLVRRNKLIVDQVNAFGSDLHSVLNAK
jgi:biopolymer transport protein ExbB